MQHRLLAMATDTCMRCSYIPGEECSIDLLAMATDMCMWCSHIPGEECSIDLLAIGNRYVYGVFIYSW